MYIYSNTAQLPSYNKCIPSVVVNITVEVIIIHQQNMKYVKHFLLYVYV